MSGYVDIVRILLKFEVVDVNVRNRSLDSAENLYTAFQFASLHGNTEVVKCLLSDQNLDVNTVSENGRTPLMVASSEGYVEIVRALLSHENIDVHAKTTAGSTALLLVAQIHPEQVAEPRYIEIVRLLMDTDLNPNEPNDYSMTALAWASFVGNTPLVELLISYKSVDVNVRANRGCSPMDLAALMGHDDVVKVLKPRTAPNPRLRVYEHKLFERDVEEKTSLVSV